MNKIKAGKENENRERNFGELSTADLAVEPTVSLYVHVLFFELDFNL